MKVYVFGNEDVKQDSFAISVAKELQKRIENGEFSDLKGLEFEFVKPNQDLPFENSADVVIMDVVKGISGPQIIKDADLSKLISSPRSTVHDFDLGFQLKYLKKLGKIGKVTIIALPMSAEMDYSSIHSISKKLVAQDMQGS